MEKYQIGKLIGIGQAMEGTQVLRASEGKFYVVKKLRMIDLEEKERENIQNELKLLQKLRHANIVSFKDSFTDKDGNLCIVMSYCESGDMYSRIRSTKEKGKSFSEGQILDWIAQTALAILYLHNQKILHRDLKSQNLFLKKDDKVRLGDFGIAKVLDNTQDLASTCIGTPYYMAPEIFKYKSYSYKCDVWSFGVIIYQMCNLRLPFEAQSYNALAIKIIKGSYPTITPTYSKQLRDLVTSMLSLKPQNRPTIVDVINKPFIKKRVEKYIHDSISRNKVADNDDIFLDSLRQQAGNIGITLSNHDEETIGVSSYKALNFGYDFKDDQYAFVDNKKKTMMEKDRKNSLDRKSNLHDQVMKNHNHQKFIQEENIKLFQIQEDYSMSDEPNASSESSIDEEIIREDSDEDLTELTSTQFNFDEEEQAPENYNKSYYKILDQTKVLKHICETGIGTNRYIRAFHAVINGSNKSAILQILGEEFIGYWHLLDQICYNDNILKSLSKE